MKKTKSLSKIFMATFFAFAMLFTGAVFALPQNSTQVYAESGIEPTAMTATYNSDTVKFYPVSTPSGIKYYIKTSSGEFRKIDNVYMQPYYIGHILSGSRAADQGGQYYSSDGTLYYTNISDSSTIPCVGVISGTWENTFNSSGNTCAASSLKLSLPSGVTTPYFPANSSIASGWTQSTTNNPSSLKNL